MTFYRSETQSKLEMASEDRGSRALLLLLILCIILISCSNVVVLAQNQPAFACDVGRNPGLAEFRFCNTSLDTKTRVDDLVKRLTLQEKMAFLVNGAGNVSRLGIPRYDWWSEALHGVAFPHNEQHFTRLVPGATSFPQVILTAASWNDSLFEAIGEAVSTEARAMYNVGLAGLTYWSPNVNIFRDPRWGRGQETPGEDPKLTSRFTVAYVNGLQSARHCNKNRLKVAACCKHYTAYDLDNWKGISRHTFNAEVTKQDMEDTFQPPFKSCVLDGNVACVMCSYNQVNGKPTCGDPDLLVGVIRGTWKLNGYIVSDCDSLDTMFYKQHWTKTPEETAASALLAGLDLNCGSFLNQHTEAAVKEGLVKESEVNRALSNNFATLMRLGFFDGDPRKQVYGNLGPKDICTKENQELAREAARQGIVLLKNSPGSLPLSPNAIRILAVIGPNANAKETMLGNYYGVPCNYITPFDGIADASGDSTIIVSDSSCIKMTCDSTDMHNGKSTAASADAVILVMGADQTIETEGTDRVDITLPGQQNLFVSEAASVAKGPVILVIMSGGGMDIQFAKDNPNITSILWVGYPGEAGGAAIADVIFGHHNPSGRLPMTWYPQSYVEKVPMMNMNMRPDAATGYPGRTYRFYTGPTVYNFGDGLSYSKFSHQLVKAPKIVTLPVEEGHVCLLSSSTCKSIDVVQENCKNLTFDIHLRVQNTEGMSGGHTVFLFSSPPPMHNSPQKQLLDFQKVFLGAGEKRLVRFNVDVCKHLSVVDEVGSKKVGLGLHVLHVGNVKHSLTVSI